jgi:tRNA 2-thiouridine synthesizing protein E
MDKNALNRARHHSAAHPQPVFDEDGFLQDTHAWTKDVSRQIAQMDGRGSLSPDHWAIILYLRGHYLATGELPVMRHVCRICHVDKDAVPRLFGSCREAWRIAGLPNPGEEAKSYMN